MLFFKEFKKVIFSLTFILYFIAAIAMYFTQFDADFSEKEVPPVESSENYGMIPKEIPELLMPAAIESLIFEYQSNDYYAYPFGFYKAVHLNEKEKNKIADIICEITGLTNKELDDDTVNQFPISISDSVTYERFRELMRKADDIIGGGSKYGDEKIVDNFSLVPKKYEDVLKEYEQFKNEDRISGGYARLFCDYMGIVLSILPVFVAVSLVGLDRKSHIDQLIYSRKISSAKLVFTRYIALVAAMMIPLIIAAVLAQIKVMKLYPDENIDNLAMLKYAVVWLIPNIMTASAVGMLITELYSGLIAIIIQCFWWFIGLTSATDALWGNIGKFTFIVRHNTIYDLDAFNNDFNNFIFNRIFYTVFSILLILVTVLIYEKKRTGVYNGLSFTSKASKRKSKA